MLKHCRLKIKQWTIQSNKEVVSKEDTSFDTFLSLWVKRPGELSYIFKILIEVQKVSF